MDEKKRDYLHICLVMFLVFSAVMFAGYAIYYYYPILKELITTGAIS